MLIFGKFRFGFFFTKQDIDYTNKHIAIGFRISWKERSFHDVYLYPYPHIHSTRW